MIFPRPRRTMTRPQGGFCVSVLVASLTTCDAGRLRQGQACRGNPSRPARIGPRPLPIRDPAPRRRLLGRLAPMVAVQSPLSGSGSGYRRGVPSMRSDVKRIIISSALLAAIAATPVPASARDGWNAAGAVIGAAGGLALGSALAANSYYPGKLVAPGRPVYVVAPAPVYVESFDEGPVCFVKRRRYVDEFGDVVIRRVRICE